MIATLQAENAKISATLRAHDQLVQALRLRIAKLQKQAFGASSEKIEREIEQLELALEDLLVAVAEAEDAPLDEDEAVAPSSAASEPVENKPRRRPRVFDTTPRERRELDPGAACPDCGDDLRIVGEDVSELLDMITAQLKVIEIARMGADIPDSTLVDWCGRSMQVLQPIIERIEAHIMASDLLHTDDTPIRVLDRSRRDKGLGKGVKQGRIWAYVRDQRPWAGVVPPGVVYYFAPDRKGEHVRKHLQTAAASCKRTPMPGSMRSMRKALTAAVSSAKPLAGRIFAATSMMSGRHTSLKSPARPSTTTPLSGRCAQLESGEKTGYLPGPTPLRKLWHGR
jgi:transposase